MTRRFGYWPYVLYGATGFSGLLAEQGFEKYVSLLVGATASASAIVIFTYFLGFAIGGVGTGVLQKRGRIRKPLSLYGALELLIGILCILFTAAFHPLVENLAPLQGYLGGAFLKGVARFSFSSLFILPVAVLMGASFPLVAYVVDPRDCSGGRLWVRTYAANLVGAALAAFASPYFIAPLIGIRGSFWLCFSIGLVVFLVCAALQHGAVPEPSPKAAELSPPALREKLDQYAWLLLAASFGCGAIIFILEVLWTHLIAVVLGCSVYAFSSMLLMVLVGLLIGALRAGDSLRGGKQVQYHVLFQNCAFLITLQIVSWGVAPLLFAFTPPKIFQNFYSVEAYKLLLAGLLILPSSTLMGTIYPSLLGSPVLKKQGRAYLVGYMNASNALGCLAGTLLAIFVLIPKLGSEISMKLILIGLVMLAFLFLPRERPGKKAWLNATAIAVLILTPAMLFRWNPAILASGMNVYFGAAKISAPRNGSETVKEKLIYVHEGVQGGFTTVVEQTIAGNNGVRKIRTLLTNGKFQGDDNPGGEQDAQAGFSVVPSLFVNGWDRALLIGLGTGHSAVTLKHLGFKEIDVAEFAPSIIEAAGQCFSRLNEGILADPAVHLKVEDGRNLLLTNRNRLYDLVTIEVSSVWFSGSTNLYAREFYELVNKRLRRGGVLQQWIQVHHISPRELTSAVATVKSVFRYVSFWYFGNQGMIVASNNRQTLDQGRITYIANALSRSRTMSPAAAERFVNRVAASRLASPDSVGKIVSTLHPIVNTDHNRWIEYATPRYNATDYNWAQHNVDFFAKFQQEGARVNEQ